ncbi:hypothetical protein DACRYDRAFT_47503 [Dacryopinax primogenitus]|uniref:Prokaryotic-type class I peptide chain release factors domain-containing protein n=1 Tax=Dacryopinax primogenitus (strain DJM 731) TaxID=1858805 RepID=M5GDL4_DACPD|nr:uncharacterized protein DACRYDRAFT_47503 [Dacryopinax primogenitus]EJU04622.1 hypothetical protein DACRYDRAFT_47503 [Dacryopinax primogenitus]
MSNFSPQLLRSQSGSPHHYRLGLRAFHTSVSVRFTSHIAPVLPHPLTHESTPTAFEYLDSLTPESIPHSTCVVEFSRSSGPGGQNVNKLNTKATLRMSLKPLPSWVPAWCVDGLRSSKEYAASSNSIVIQSSATRSQASNTDDCFRKLHALVNHHSRSVLVPIPDEEKKKRISDLERKEAARRRIMKERQKSKKAGRRGE